MNDLGSKFFGTENEVCQINLFSDASSKGWGGYVDPKCFNLEQGFEIFGAWEISERSKSSTWRELEGAHRVMRSALRECKGKKVKLFTDNKNVKSIITAGSSKNDLQKVALEVVDFCTENDIKVIPEWIPRELNEHADFNSKCLDSDDWSLQTRFFLLLDYWWGPHTIDRFATHYNSKCKRFNSRVWCPGTEAVNAFDQSWEGEVNWIVPPPRLILRCLQKMRSEKARGTMIMPVWKSGIFWPFVHPTKHGFANFVESTKSLPRRNLIKSGFGNNGVFGNIELPFDMMAIKLNFD